MRKTKWVSHFQPRFEQFMVTNLSHALKISKFNFVSSTKTAVVSSLLDTNFTGAKFLLQTNMFNLSVELQGNVKFALCLIYVEKLAQTRKMNWIIHAIKSIKFKELEFWKMHRTMSKSDVICEKFSYIGTKYFSEPGGFSNWRSVIAKRLL